MKYTPSILVDELSGSAKGVTAAKRKGRKYFRTKGTGSKSNTVAQAGVKAHFKQLTQMWRTLTTAQILAWNTLAQSQEGKTALGTKSKISGSNLFMRLNYWIIATGGTILETPPALEGVEAPDTAALSLTAAAFTMTLATIPEDVSNLKLIIQCSVAQSNGVSDAYAKASQIGDPQTPVETAIALKTDYDAKYGVPTATKPKVFVKWFYVNTLTGEKSGEMIELAMLTA